MVHYPSWRRGMRIELSRAAVDFPSSPFADSLEGLRKVFRFYRETRLRPELGTVEGRRISDRTLERRVRFRVGSTTQHSAGERYHVRTGQWRRTSRSAGVRERPADLGVRRHGRPP